MGKIAHCNIKNTFTECLTIGGRSFYFMHIITFSLQSYKKNEKLSIFSICFY